MPYLLCFFRSCRNVYKLWWCGNKWRNAKRKFDEKGMVKICHWETRWHTFPYVRNDIGTCEAIVDFSDVTWCLCCFYSHTNCPLSLQEIRKGLLKAARTTGAWIFTGGTNTGESFPPNHIDVCGIFCWISYPKKFPRGLLSEIYDESICP